MLLWDVVGESGGGVLLVLSDSSPLLWYGIPSRGALEPMVQKVSFRNSRYELDLVEMKEERVASRPSSSGD